MEAKSVALFEKGRHTIEYWVLRKDGAYCWVIDEQHLIRDRDGEPVEVVGSWSDVTAPKEAEIAFRRSEQRLSDAIESLSEGFSLYDAQDRLIICNNVYGEPLYPGRGTPTPGTSYEALISNAVKRGLVEDAKGREQEWIAERLAKASPAGRAACATPRRWPLDPGERAQDDGRRNGRRLHQHHRDQARRGRVARGQPQGGARQSAGERAEAGT